MNRRSFLQAMSLPLTYSLAGPIYRRRPVERLQAIGLELYTVRDLMQVDVGRTLEKVAAIGYREVEFFSYFGESPARLRLLLDAVGLEAPSSHVSLQDLTDNPALVFDTAETIGHRYVIVPSLDPPDRRSLDDYRRVAAALNRAAEMASVRGLWVGYHNHDFELARIGGVRPYDVLLSQTDPALVCFEMDFYWMTHGGADPVAYLQRHAGRFHLCHIKDMDRRGEMTDVGAGRIDFRKILRLRETAGLRHFYVEHDHPADPLATIRASHAFLRSLEL